MLPIYSPSACKYFLNPFKHTLTNMIQDKNCIPFILETIYNGQIEFKNHKPVKKIKVTLYGDAASLKSVFKSSENAIYVFQILPLDCNLPPAVIHVMECKNGLSSQKIVKRFKELVQFLNEIGFEVKYRATDGDISFDHIHDDFFAKNINHLSGHSFEEILKNCSKAGTILLSDLLHLLKSARARMINHLIMINADELKCLNTELFAEAVNLGPVFTDKNLSGSMKDGYIFQLFSWHTFTEVMRKGRYDAAFYILPYIYVLEAVTSPVLSLSNQMNFLKSAFNIFYDQLREISQTSNSDLFQQRFHAECLGTLLGDKIFFMRMINTIVGIGVALMEMPENLPTQRLGSQDSELFFGYMRFFSYFDHTYSNAVRVAVRSIIIHHYSNDINYHVKVSKRANKAGIILTKEINERNDTFIDCNFIRCKRTHAWSLCKSRLF